jgi:hypothetical protein
LQNRRMEPRPSLGCEDQGEMPMERTRLANLLNERHPLVRLARQIDWRSFDEHFGTYYSEGTGRPATSTRLMVSLHYLKATPTTSPRRRFSGGGWRTHIGSISVGWSSSSTSRP